MCLNLSKSCPFFCSISSIDSFSWHSHATSVLAFMVRRPFSFPCWISSYVLLFPSVLSVLQQGWYHSCAQTGTLAQVSSNLGSCADHAVCLESHSVWCQILLIVYPLLKKKFIYHPPLFGLIMACKSILNALFSPLQALLFCVSHRYLWICPPTFYIT